MNSDQWIIQSTNYVHFFNSTPLCEIILKAMVRWHIRKVKNKKHTLQSTHHIHQNISMCQEIETNHRSYFINSHFSYAWHLGFWVNEGSLMWCWFGIRNLMPNVRGLCSALGNVVGLVWCLKYFSQFSRLAQFECVQRCFLHWCRWTLVRDKFQGMH